MTERSTCEQKLWQRYSSSRNIADKNELVMHYLPAVKRAALKLMPTYHAYLSFDDMVSSGVIGLMDAIEKFDASQGARFETYSALRIRGEILDSIRAQDWASDSLRRRLKALQRAQLVLQETLGREPDDRELAAYLHISEAALREAREKDRTFSVVYFEDLDGGEGVPCADALPEETAEYDEMVETLARAIDCLPEKQRLVIALYYYEELTQKEIAAVLGVTESRICQIRMDAVRRLQTALQREMRAV
jgi:RNA polymerase sigma factor for flagellar operon FliA